MTKEIQEQPAGILNSVYRWSMETCTVGHHYQWILYLQSHITKVINPKINALEILSENHSEHILRQGNFKMSRLTLTHERWKEDNALLSPHFSSERQKE